MTKLRIALAATAAVAGGMAVTSTPAQGQSAVAEIIVFGNDPCPRSTDDQVVVCARRPERDRYRLPERYRPSGTPQQRMSWANKARSIETVSGNGINSCSPVGPGGHTGCLTQVINQARREARQTTVETTAPED